MATKLQLKPLIAPLMVATVVGAVAVLQYFGVINLAAISLPSSPEFDAFRSDLPSILVAFLFGALGAFVRIAINAAPSNERVRRLTVGGVIGVIAFIVIKSNVLPEIMYRNASTDGLEISFYGLALIAVLAGMYGAELVRWGSSRS